MDRYSILLGKDCPEESNIYTDNDIDVLSKAIRAEAHKNITRHLYVGSRRTGKTYTLIRDMIEVLAYHPENRVLFCTLNLTMQSNIREIYDHGRIIWATSHNFESRSRGYSFAACYFDEISFYGTYYYSEFFRIIEKEIRTEKVLMNDSLSSFASKMLQFLRHKGSFWGPWNSDRFDSPFSPFVNYDGEVFYHDKVPWQLHVLTEMR